MVQGAEKKTHYAMCILNPDGGSGVSGFTKFVQNEGEQILIMAEMNGLTPGQHGFHVLQFGKFSFLANSMQSSGSNTSFLFLR